MQNRSNSSGGPGTAHNDPAGIPPNSGGIRDRGDRVCIIGAGPAGLAMTRSLLAKGIGVDVYEKHSDVGGIWDPANPGSPIYKSAHFISSKTMSAYFDYPMPDDYPDYPDNRQVLAYHRSFARAYDLYRHIQFNTPVRSVEKLAQHKASGERWLVTLANGGQLQYGSVVCASGITWDPVMPDLPGAESFMGEIMHSVSYRDADLFRGKRVLVIGAGNSGCDIACDAGQSADAAFISVRRGYYFIPKHILGQPADVFGESSKWMPTRVSQFVFGKLLKLLIGDLTKLGLPAPDHRILESHPIMNDQLIHNLRHGDVRAKGDVVRLHGDSVEFKDGSREKIDIVVCATGYKWSIPYMSTDYFRWRGGRPDLYLSLFNRDHANLFALGYMETDGGAYKLFDEMADLISAYLKAKRHNHASAEKFARLIQTDRPDLSGGVQYIQSDRHAAYVNKNAYLKYIRKIRDRMGWPNLAGAAFDALKADRAGASPAGPEIANGTGGSGGPGEATSTAKRTKQTTAAAGGVSSGRA